MYTYTAAITEEGTCYIGNSAFAHHRDLKFLVFPEGVKSITIGDRAFQDCNRLESLVFPAGVESITIGEWAFWRCNIESLVFPEGVESITIGKRAFAGRESLESLVFPEGVESITIGGWAFWGCNIESLVFPEGVESITIGKRAFAGCNIQSLVFPPGVESITIGEGAFGWCHNLKSLVFPAGVKSITIDYGAFLACGSLQFLVFPEGIESITIGEKAFRSCRNIKSLVFPPGVESITIGNEAFRWCRNLKSLDFPEGQKNITIGNEAFSGCDIKSLVFHGIDIEILNDTLLLVPENSSTSNKRDYFLNMINLALVQINASDTLSSDNKNDLLNKLLQCVESRRGSERNPFFGAYFNLQLDGITSTINSLVEMGEEDNGIVRFRRHCLGQGKVHPYVGHEENAEKEVSDNEEEFEGRGDWGGENNLFEDGMELKDLSRLSNEGKGVSDEEEEFETQEEKIDTESEPDETSPVKLGIFEKKGGSEDENSRLDPYEVKGEAGEGGKPVQSWSSGL